MNIRQCIKAYVASKPDRDVDRRHVLTVGSKYVTWVGLWEGARIERIEIEEFFCRYVKGTCYDLRRDRTYEIRDGVVDLPEEE
jgi:hypothetical protein